jgi:rhodanese-related sulfurtransferase
MMNFISYPDFDKLREGDTQWALFDIRDSAEADAAHIPGVCFLPRRMIELRIRSLVPDVRTPIVIYDDGASERAEMALEAFARVGYRNVRVLEGGLLEWLRKRRFFISGTNVPSKIFAERMHEARGVPQISALELKEWQDRNKECIVCDIRSPVEYANNRIPHAIGAFGVDVALVAEDLKEKGLPVVVHCSGRTRGLIACQSLRELGLKDVYALENGTMGWQLARFALERGQSAGVMTATAKSIDAGRGSAKKLALSAGVVELTAQELRALTTERGGDRKNVYLYDVRQVEEYVVEHIEGAQTLPGGLAVQRADDFAPVRRGAVVFVDDDTGRAHLTAFWFRKMGWPCVYVLRGGQQAWKAAGYATAAGRGRTAPLGFDQAKAQTTYIKADVLASLARKPLVVHVDTSKSYKTARVPGSIWIPYCWVEFRWGKYVTSHDARIILTCRTGLHSTYSAANLKRLGYTSVEVLEGGVNAWKSAFAVENNRPADTVVTSPPDVATPPYESSLENMNEYLAWERQLTADVPESVLQSWPT